MPNKEIQQAIWQFHDVTIQLYDQHLTILPKSFSNGFICTFACSTLENLLQINIIEPGWRFKHINAKSTFQQTTNSPAYKTSTFKCKD